MRGERMELRWCKTCERKLPITNEYFEKDCNKKYGFGYKCKDCAKKYKKQRYENNKEKTAKSHAEYYSKNKEVIAKNHKQYFEINKAQLSEHMKIYYKDNKDAISEQKKQYCSINKDRIAERIKQYYNNNKEYSCKYAKQYAKDNPEKRRIIEQKRKARKRNLIHTLTEEEWEQTKKHFNNNCAYCGKKLPLTQDHFIPLSKNGEYTASNIIPACKSCNSSKGNKKFVEWYPKYKYYTKVMANQIYEFLKCSENECKQMTLAVSGRRFA